MYSEHNIIQGTSFLHPGKLYVVQSKVTGFIHMVAISGKVSLMQTKINIHVCWYLTF
jgi:hypothetical protein